MTTIDEHIARLATSDAPELTDAALETLRRMSSDKPTRPTQLTTRRNQRGHILRHMRLLARHGFAERVSGGYVSKQCPLPLFAGDAP